MEATLDRINNILDEETAADLSVTISQLRTLSGNLAVLIDTSSSELKAAIADEVVEALPVGQQYRDLVKLIPGVQYTEDSIRGPSAGGSGQDNVYQFDGVNVGLPLFGVLAAEPSSHDIEQVAIVKGGASAQDFNRSGGFTINTVSKSGTSKWRGDLQYQIQTDSMTGNRATTSAAEFESDKDWTTLSLGGPLVGERLFFYGSYYRPTEDRANRSNFYGAVPNFEVERDEFFGKLTFTPSGNVTIHTSYRDSEEESTGSSVGGEADAGSTSEGSTETFGITTLYGTWLIDNQSFLDFKYSDFENETSGRPDNLFNFGILPLTFRDPADYGLFQTGSAVVFPDVRKHIDAGDRDLPVTVDGREVTVRLEASPRQREMLIAGGAVNAVRKRMGKGR